VTFEHIVEQIVFGIRYSVTIDSALKVVETDGTFTFGNDVTPIRFPLIRALQHQVSLYERGVLMWSRKMTKICLAFDDFRVAIEEFVH
jgi:hypothetical protein